MQVQSSTVEENFVFGSPPLLNGFTYNTCRSQEANVKTTSNHEYPYHFTDNSSQPVSSPATENENYYSAESTEMSSSPGIHLNNFKYQTSSYGGNFHNRGMTNYHLKNNGIRNIDTMFDNLNQLSLSRTSHVDNGIRILEQAGVKVQKNINEPVFKKRKDLRVLKSVLSSERFREVVMKFGDGDEGGREIVESVHKAMRNSNLSVVSCLFCHGESQVYENFPIVDGTLFLTPVSLSKHCVKFEDKMNGSRQERYMCFVCVSCLEGKPKAIRCSSCQIPWNGSFFQVGTLYSYNILSAIPCCNLKVSCNRCNKAIIDLTKGEASTLYFSHSSTKTTCPNCQSHDFHFVKSLSTLSRSSLPETGVSE